MTAHDLGVGHADRLVKRSRFGVKFLFHTQRAARFSVQRANKNSGGVRQAHALCMRDLRALRHRVRGLHAVLAHEQLALTSAHHTRALPAVVAKLNHTAIALPEQLRTRA